MIIIKTVGYQYYILSIVALGDHCRSLPSELVYKNQYETYN